MIEIYRKYAKTIKTFLWGLVGIIVSLGIIGKNNTSLFAWPLFILSCLMFLLAVKYLIEERNQKKIK